MHGSRRGGGCVCERVVGGERRLPRHMLPEPERGRIESERAAVVRTKSPSQSLPRKLLSCNFFLKDGRKVKIGDCALFQAGDAPPFIGLIRWFKTGGDGFPKLCVSWLYRPADVKLGKGIQLDAAPNEVFYSFHKDVISAASLLHPCKVAFLRKGAELQAGTSSFVCRRVYDIVNRCLWWLSDKDYIDEHQEEIDQLLNRAKEEMHSTVQSGGKSPKQLNCAALSEHSKSGSDSAQSKVRKRERSDSSTEALKRESIHLAKCQAGAVAVAEITEKNRLDDVESVEKLVKTMQADRAERKIGSSGRLMIANIIAATDKSDYLGRIVQLGGVPVLDEWLQEAHKGKICDGGSPGESDEVMEDLVLALLHALEKLPVNLSALQACQIGKSVNHLRGHKNAEIQKKARKLVDTWKTRVAAEWKTGQMLAVSKGSSSAVASTSPKMHPHPPAQLTVSVKDSSCVLVSGNGNSESPHATMEDNSIQSCAGDNSKAPCPSSASPSSSKSSSGSLQHKRVTNTTQTSADKGSIPRLVVKFPNLGRSPVRSANKIPLDDRSANGGVASSPALSDNQEPDDSDMKMKCTGIKEAPQSCKGKSVIGTQEGDASPKLVDCPSERAEEECKDTVAPALSSPSSRDEKNALVCVLIESHANANAQSQAEEDTGMNILARVAAEEITSESMPSTSLVVVPALLDRLDRDECQASVSSPLKSRDNVVPEKHFRGDTELSTDEDPRKISEGPGHDDGTCVKEGSVEMVTESDVLAPQPEAETCAACGQSGEDVQDTSNIGSPQNVALSGLVPKGVMQPESSPSHLPETDCWGAVQKKVNDDLDACTPTGDSSLVQLLVSHVATLDSVGEDRKMNFHELDAKDSIINGDVKTKSDSGETAMLDFDLNEGVPGDDSGGKWDLPSSTAMSSSVHPPQSSGLPGNIMITAPAKGPFVSSENMVRCESKMGWKGLAPGSAFWPAEPKRTQEMQVDDSLHRDASGASGKSFRAPIEIDLNVVDDGVLNYDENNDASSHSVGILGLDLNSMEEQDAENDQVASACKSDVHSSHRRGWKNEGLPEAEPSSRDFDLNNGPSLEDGAEPVLPNFVLKSANNVEVGSAVPWFHLGNGYPAGTVPSFLPDRAKQPYMFLPAAGCQRVPNSGARDYVTPVVPASQVMPFSVSPQPYSPFGAGFSFEPRTTFPVIPRPYFLKVPEDSNSLRWQRQSLDLNAGPGSTADHEAKNDILHSSSRQNPGPQAKRKEPDGGWEAADRSQHKHLPSGRS